MSKRGNGKGKGGSGRGLTLVDEKKTQAITNQALTTETLRTQLEQDKTRRAREAEKECKAIMEALRVELTCGLILSPNGQKFVIEYVGKD